MIGLSESEIRKLRRKKREETERGIQKALEEARKKNEAGLGQEELDSLASIIGKEMQELGRITFQESYTQRGYRDIKKYGGRIARKQGRTLFVEFSRESEVDKRYIDCIGVLMGKRIIIKRYD